MPETLKSLH